MHPNWIVISMACEIWSEVLMTIRGHVQNGVVVLDPPAALPDGTLVRVEPLSVPADPGCFAAVQRQPAFDPVALAAMPHDLTPDQYEALQAIAAQGGPDLDAISRLRAASMT